MFVLTKIKPLHIRIYIFHITNSRMCVAGILIIETNHLSYILNSQLSLSSRLEISQKILV